MIIIKTQMGAILKTDHILPEHSGTIKCFDHTCSLVELGKYDSIERGKEVMAMIEEHIKDKYMVDIYCKVGTNPVGTDTMQEVMQALDDNFSELAIFTMPKE